MTPWALVGMAGGPSPAPRYFILLELGGAMAAGLDAVLMMWASLAAPLAVTGSRITVATMLFLALQPSLKGDCPGNYRRRGCTCLIKASAEAFRPYLPSLSPSATTSSRST